MVQAISERLGATRRKDLPSHAALSMANLRAAQTKWSCEKRGPQNRRPLHAMCFLAIAGCSCSLLPSSRLPADTTSIFVLLFPARHVRAALCVAGVPLARWPPFTLSPPNFWGVCRCVAISTFFRWYDFRFALRTTMTVESNPKFAHHRGGNPIQLPGIFASDCRATLCLHWKYERRRRDGRHVLPRRYFWQAFIPKKLQFYNAILNLHRFLNPIGCGGSAAHQKTPNRMKPTF